MFDTFWSDFLANLFSDILVAIALGLAVSSYLANREGSSRREDILALIKMELEKNLVLANGTLKSLKENKTISVPGLKTEIWDMFKNSGQLSWLSNDLVFLHQLSNGYNSIKGIKEHEAHFLNAISDFQNRGEQVMLINLTESLIRGYQQFIDETTKFLRNGKMKTIKTPNANEEA